MSAAVPYSSDTTAPCPWCGAALTRGGTCPACVAGFDESEAPVAMEIAGFELLEQIGRGGMGVVFKARQRSLGRTVAVKMLAGGPLASATFVARFKAEAESVAALQHPGLVAVHEVGEDDAGTPWFSMDYIAGPSLSERLKSGPLEPKEAARLTKLIAEAIHYAHSHGLLHRDLKPSNILLDEFEQPRVTDFGIARRMDDDSTLTITGDILGSPAYMPPEQAAGRSAEVTAASDVYSLGAVLYEMLTGRAPFIAASRGAVLDMVKAKEPLPPRSLNPAIPAELETVCLKCLEKDAAGRYATAAELAGEMERFLRGDPVLARPVSAVGRVWRWARRNKAAAAAAASLFFGLTGIASVLLVMNLRVSRAKGEAETNLRLSERHAAESRENLARSYLVTANHYLAEADHQRALLWLLQAWETTADPAERRLIGMSLATTLRITPKLSKVWAPGGAGECAVFDPKANRIACASGSPEVLVWSSNPNDDSVLTLTHEGGAYHCAFNADGTRLFTQGDADVRLWDTATGTQIGNAQPQLKGGIYFSNRKPPVFSADGKLLLTFTPDGAQLINTATGEITGAFLKNPAPLTVATVLPDGTRCLLGGGKQVRLVASSSGEEIASWTIKETPRVLSFDLPAQNFCALSGNGTMEVFSLNNPSAAPIAISSSGVNYQAVFSPDGHSILATSFAGQARIFDSASGARVQEFDHDGGVSRAIWLPGRALKIASASWDNTVRLWRVSEGQRLGIFHHGGRTMSVDAADGPQRLLTASADGSVRLHDLTADPAQSLMHARLKLSRTRPAAAGVTWINDRVVRGCHPATGEAFGPPLPHQHPVIHAALAADVNHVATLTDDGTVHLWDASGLIPLPLAIVPSEGAAVASLMFSADGARLLLLRSDASFTVLDGKGQTVANPISPGVKLRAWGVSRNDRIFAALGTDGKAQAWSLRDGKAIGPRFGPERGAWSLTIAPDGEAVCLNEGPPDTADVKRSVRLWDPITGLPLTPPLEHYDDIGAIAFSPDGRLIATGSEDYQVIIWDRRTGQPASSTWHHSFWPKSLAFSPDSRVLAVAGHDSSFAFLRTADCTLIGPKRKWLSPPQFITFSESGDSLLAVRSDDAKIEKSAVTVFEINLAPVEGDAEKVRDAVTLASGMVLEKAGVLRMLTADELVALSRKVRGR